MEPQQCWHLLALVAYSLKPVKLLAQQVPTFLLFCDHEVEQLIDLLEENFCLWDVSNKDYYLREKRERPAYKQIEEKIGTERAVIKAKITTLRRQCWQLLRSFASVP